MSNAVECFKFVSVFENPATGRRFFISLRDWQGALWAVRVLPATPRPADKINPFGYGAGGALRLGSPWLERRS